MNMQIRNAGRQALIVDVRDVDEVAQLLRPDVRLYLMLFSDSCYRNPRCYNVELIMRSDAPGYGLIVDYDPGAEPEHLRGWRIRGWTFWRDYDLVVALLDMRPDVVIVSNVAEDRYLADATAEYADDLGISVKDVDVRIPGDVMAVFAEGRGRDVVAYLQYAVERLRSHL